MATALDVAAAILDHQRELGNETTTPSDIKVERAQSRDVERAMNRALKSAGVTLPELKKQARCDQFSSEAARMAWFMISPFVDWRTRRSSRP